MSKLLPAVLGEVPQQILGQQDADDLVAILADDREPRVAGFDHDGEDLLGRVFALDHDHLRPRHHDVPHLDLGDLQHRLEHFEHVGIDQAALARVGQHVRELLEIARFAGKRVCEAPQPAAARRTRMLGTTHTASFVAQRYGS